MITIYLKQYNKIIRNADTRLFDELGYDDILWIDMLQPTIKEQKAVENFMEISLQTKQQVEEIESTSKYSEGENAIVSNSNFFVPTGDSFIVEPVSFIISNEGVLVSVRNTEFRTFRETEKRLQMSYRSYSTGYHLFISLLEVRIDFDADLVELISKQVSALSKDVNSEDRSTRRCCTGSVPCRRARCSCARTSSTASACCRASSARSVSRTISTRVCS